MARDQRARFLDRAGIAEQPDELGFTAGGHVEVAGERGAWIAAAFDSAGQLGAAGDRRGHANRARTAEELAPVGGVCAGRNAEGRKRDPLAEF